MLLSPVNISSYGWMIMMIAGFLIFSSLTSLAQFPGLLSDGGNLKPHPAPLSGHFLRVDDGYISYNLDYRSTIDTPFAEKNILQHSLNATMHFTVEGSLPFVANAWFRRTNSPYFRDINDVQVLFNTAAFHNGVAGSLRNKWASLARNPADSLMESAYQLKNNELNKLGGWLQNPFQLQKLIEANETLKVRAKSYNPALPDSVNQKNADSAQRVAREFLETYHRTKERYDSLNTRLDSLKSQYEAVRRRAQKYRDMLNGGGPNRYSLQELEEALKQEGGDGTTIPSKDKWLLGIRNFGIGKTPANYSELTAKNTSLTGVNFEYNSRYYFAVSAGLIDYRFRDFGPNTGPVPRQYMFLVRAGIGRLEKNYLIFSFFQGKKQLFNTPDSSGRIIAVPVTGVSAEMKWSMNRFAYIVTEAAQSLSPDYRYSPPVSKTGINFSDKTNKALSVSFHGYLPSTGSGLDAMYKFTGANFQSFSSYQTNSEYKTWYIKVDQTFLKRTLKLTASLRSNDFSNPYIVQAYSGNTVFKTLQVSYHARNLPSLTLGYIPISQLSVSGSQVVENRFQSLTANINHYYKIGLIRMASTAVLNKFYNKSTDTSFLFYNATNIVIDQRFFFRDFTAGISFSGSEAAHYTMNVASEEVGFTIRGLGSASMGARINTLNKTQTRLGEFCNINIRISRADYLTLNVEHSYLPSSAGNLVPNDFGTIQFMKRIK